MYQKQIVDMFPFSIIDKSEPLELIIPETYFIPNMKYDLMIWDVKSQDSLQKLVIHIVVIGKNITDTGSCS